MHRLYGILVEMKSLLVIKFQENKDLIYNLGNPLIRVIRDSDY